VRADEATPPADRLTFEKDVAPLLAKHCGECHGAAKQEANLDLRRRFAILDGGDGGPAIEPGKPDKSLLLGMIEEGDMPPEGKNPLTEKQVALLRRWIAQGAPIAGKESPLPQAADITWDEETRNHWSFQPIRRVDPPSVQQADWIQTPVDAFILKALEDRDWAPSPAASKEVLIRRVTFDLTGLPPTPAEIAAYLNDSGSQAYAKVVDRLLASKHYGERWAQHWLDVVRYAETEGFEYDRRLPGAWRFRDYVIDSFNADLPLDEFIRDQIAGDEIAPHDPNRQAASIFHRLGAVRRNAGNPDIALSRNEVLTERTNIVGAAFLGLTVGCARCHNHKLEPISQRDYYRLQAYFAATAEHNIVLATTAEQKAWQAKTDKLQAQIKKLKAKLDGVPDDQQAQVQAAKAKLEAALPDPLPTVPSTHNDWKNATAVHVLRRGVWENKAEPVRPRPLSVLTSTDTPALPEQNQQPRTALAHWLTDPDHPLTSRVLVNRVWQHHFGMGLVETANDFGVHGAKPSHGDLLDYLAAALIDHDWRLKPIHRMIALSSVYQQSSGMAQHTDQGANSPAAKDPDNRMLSHFSRRRLEAEEIRDAMLQTAGRLNRTVGGPSVITPVDEELVQLLYKPSQWKVSADEADHDRRAIYLIAKRNLRLPFMEAFDSPDLQTSCPQREASTHAPQALELLNGHFANAMAEALQTRLEKECGEDDRKIVERAFVLGLGRSPSHAERRLSLEYLEEQSVKEFALAIFNLNSFLYVE